MSSFFSHLLVRLAPQITIPASSRLRIIRSFRHLDPRFRARCVTTQLLRIAPHQVLFATPREPRTTFFRRAGHDRHFPLPLQTKYRCYSTQTVNMGDAPEPKRPRPGGAGDVFVGSIDQGTTSTRFVIFNTNGEPIAIHQMGFKNIHPESGYALHHLLFWTLSLSPLTNASQLARTRSP